MKLCAEATTIPFPSSSAAPLDIPREDVMKRVAWSNQPVACLLLLRPRSFRASDVEVCGLTPCQKYAIKSGKEYYLTLQVLFRSCDLSEHLTHVFTTKMDYIM
jgi:hypothetical protein